MAMTSGADAALKRELVILLPRMQQLGRSLAGTKELADELVQAACERALQRFHQWGPGTRVDHWLFAIMRSIWSNELRARRVRLGGGLVDADTLVDHPVESQLEARLMLDKIDGILADLPGEQRAVLRLVCVEGHSYREAAEALNIPLGTLMSRLARGRVAIAEQLSRATATASRA
jgi:RNA polymerase sigma-70 factor (ECF subfamily)